MLDQVEGYNPEVAGVQQTCSFASWPWVVRSERMGRLFNACRKAPSGHAQISIKAGGERDRGMNYHLRRKYFRNDRDRLK